jgi:lipopolysaccharide/colanic/teichoic acid biosynthesis glycosyltransferase
MPPITSSQHEEGAPAIARHQLDRPHLKSYSRPSIRTQISHRLQSWSGASTGWEEGDRQAATPWTTLIDGMGLLLAIVAVAALRSLDEQITRLLVTLMLTSGLYMWFLISQLRSLETVLRRDRALPYAVPLMAAGASLAVSWVAGIGTSYFALIVFPVIWTGVQFLGRLVLKRFQVQRPLKILVIGRPAFSAELQDVRGIVAESRTEPPARVRDWDIVMIDPAEQYDAQWWAWMAHADMYGVRILSAPLVLETLTRRVPIDMLSGRWAFEILYARSSYLFWKRLLDLAVVIVFAPLILIVGAAVALAVVLATGSPVFFWQVRVGAGGKPFRMVKFRTMRPDAEANGSAFATATDGRVTRVGRFLRQYRLDEIPQFWNVLLGDMSIIGPRPEQREFASRFETTIPLYRLRSNLRPGITGWAQVMHGYAADTAETKMKLQHDFYYVKHCSFFLDLQIVLKTLRTIVSGFGAR